MFGWPRAGLRCHRGTVLFDPGYEPVWWKFAGCADGLVLTALLRWGAGEVAAARDMRLHRVACGSTSTRRDRRKASA